MITVRHCDKLAARYCRRSTEISAHLSIRVWRSSPRFWGGFSILLITRPSSSQIWLSRRLLHLGDFALLKEIKDYRSMVRYGVIILVAVVIPELLPGKWH